MNNKRDVYLFKKDGSYEVTRTNAKSVAYYPEDVNKVYSGNFGNSKHIRHREIDVENVEIKTLVKVVNVDPMLYIQEPPDNTDWWRKGDLKWFELISYRDNMMYDTVECKFEINYAVVKDSPLNSIIESLESVNKDAVDWRGKYLKQEDSLNHCVSDRNKLRVRLSDKTAHSEDMRRTLNCYYKINSKPTLYFIYTLFVTWVLNIFSKEK